MLVLSRKPRDGEKSLIVIGEDIRLTVLDVKGDVVKLGIEAPSARKILRGELIGKPPKTDGDDDHEKKSAA